METRKVQVTGGSTYTVSLPKGWATDNGVSGGSVVEFHPEADTLLLTPQSEEEKTEGELDITGLEGDELMRAVVTMYVSGFDIVTLETAQVTAAQRRTIREATQGLVGLEVSARRPNGSGYRICSTPRSCRCTTRSRGCGSSRRRCSPTP